MSSNRDRVISALRVALVAAACFTVGWIVYRLTGGTGDYSIRGQVMGDNAGPALNALAHGHLGAMAGVQPLMGLTSIVLRAPLVVLAGALGGGARLAYGLGSMACLLPAAALVAWLVRRAVSPTQLAAAALAAVAIVAGPATRQAVQVGHPEEVLATVLAAGAVLSALEERRGWAAVLLGLAIGTKQWAFLAAPCVLLALPNDRVAVATKAFLVAAPAVVLLPLADPAAFSRADAGVGGLLFADAFSLWWPVDPVQLAGPHGLSHPIALGLTRSEAAATALILTSAAIGIYGRCVGGGWRPKVDPLALLALVGLLRCVTDPDPLTYNFIAFVIPLAVWEAAIMKRLPLATALTCGVLVLLPTDGNAFSAGNSALVGEPVLSGLWLCGVVSLGLYLVRRTFHPPAQPQAASVPRAEPMTAVLRPAVDPA